MDPKTVAAIRRIYDSENSDVGVPAFLELADPDIEFIPASDWPGMERRPRHGAEDVRAYFAHLEQAFGVIRFELEEITDYGDTLVVEARFRVEGRASGLAIERRMAHLYRFRDGRIVFMEATSDRGAAHAAAREQAARAS